MTQTTRIDKFLWAVRLLKTRSIASSECKSGKVLLNEQHVKPSTNLKKGDIIRIKKNPIWRSYQVIEILDKRVGAKLVENYIKEITPTEELERLELIKLANTQNVFREKGRPTKKERRKIDDFLTDKYLE